MTSTATLDPEPALNLAIARAHERHQPPNLDHIAQELGVTARTLSRWKHGTLLRHIDADRIAVHMGLHPLNLWAEF